MTNPTTSSDEYYPLRWKIADGVEDIVLLHRAKLIGAVIAFVAAIVIGGFLLSDQTGELVTGGQGDPVAGPPETGVPHDDDSDVIAAEQGLGVESSTTTTAAETTTSAAPETTTTTTSAPETTTTTSTTTTTTTTTTTIPESTRPAPTAEQIAAAQSGAIILLRPDSVEVIGGVPDDAAADETLALAESTFPNLPVTDNQVVDSSFAGPDNTVFRLASSDLFGYNSDELNPIYVPLIEQLGAAAQAAQPAWLIEVNGHTDNVGPTDGNQRLSERRAQSAANQLLAQGTDPAIVTVVGRGESEPIVSNSTEQGRLQNRRVEFLVTGQ